MIVQIDDYRSSRSVPQKNLQKAYDPLGIKKKALRKFYKDFYKAHLRPDLTQAQLDFLEDQKEKLKKTTRAYQIFKDIRSRPGFDETEPYYREICNLLFRD